MGKSVARVTKPPAVPRLNDGDRLGADEFLRRYAAEKRVHSAELIGGVVYVTRRRVVRDGKEMIVPPIDAQGHSNPHVRINGLLMHYEAFTPHVVAHNPTTVVLPSRDTALEPDGALRLLPEVGGGATIGSDGFIHGPPELLVEVSNTSGSRDSHAKKDAFEANGVKEYIVWQTQTGVLDWFALRRRRYAPLAPHADGSVRSGVFPGLWLDVPALLAGDMATVLATLQRGIASPEHAAFVAKLNKAATKRKK